MNLDFVEDRMLGFVELKLNFGLRVEVAVFWGEEGELVVLVVEGVGVSGSLCQRLSLSPNQNRRNPSDPFLESCWTVECSSV